MVDVDPVRIDDLDPTVTPSLDHDIPAMFGGLTRRLKVQQIVDLVNAQLVDEFTALANADIALAAADAALAALIKLPRGYLSGLTLANNATDAVNDIDIAVGMARGDANLHDMVLAAALTKRLDANWAVGTNQGGLDTGAKANSTTYHVFLIKRIDTNVVDVLLSASATAPTMPANYTVKRRVGSIRTNASGTIIQFKQYGDEFVWAVTISDVSVSSLGTTAVLYALTVPTGIQVSAQIDASVGKPSATVNVLLTCPDQPDTTPTGSISTLWGSTGSYGYWDSGIRTNTSAQIRARSSAASTEIYITTRGWVDRRGRDD